MKAIIEVQECHDQFISTIFTRPKKNGEYRVIFNLKNLNESIEYHHFKMDTVESAVNLLSKNCWMTSVDIRHAYLTVRIATEHQKYLRFRWKGKCFQYTCLPFGLSSAPRIFTKLLKPVFATLRQAGCTIIGYIDDCLIVADSKEECLDSLQKTIDMLQTLGFIINFDKSELVPQRRLEFLGHIFNSEQMIIDLPQNKKNTIILECERLRDKNISKIRDVARVIGLIVSSFSAVEYGQLHYRDLEHNKSEALKHHCGNFEASMNITEAMRVELTWWIENLNKQIRHVSHGNPQIILETDASLEGWGASVDDNQTGGRWSAQEKENHINYLELLAIYYALKSFKSKFCNKHVKILSDNTTAVSYIRKMGGIKSVACNGIASKIWEWCEKQNIWLSCAHIAGKDNKIADEKSRKFNDNIEWTLSSKVFEKICEKLGSPDVDLFATRLNTQVKKFCSWEADPDCSFVDAFTIDWKQFVLPYMFPPFSVLNHCIRKIREDQAEGILLVPLWPTQVWFTNVMAMVIQPPLLIKRSKNLLYLPNQNTVHPLWKQMTLVVCRVSGNLMKVKEFQKKLPQYSWRLGDQVQESNIRLAFENGFRIVVKGKLMNFVRL